MCGGVLSYYYNYNNSVLVTINQSDMHFIIIDCYKWRLLDKGMHIQGGDFSSNRCYIRIPLRVAK